MKTYLQHKSGYGSLCRDELRLPQLHKGLYSVKGTESALYNSHSYRKRLVIGTGKILQRLARYGLSAMTRLIRMAADGF
ncbi:MAG: hypothetical protein WBL85_07030 [Sedimentisphaerales bacterium]